MDGNGNVLQAYDYDAFGNEVETTQNGGGGSTDSNPFRFASMYLDTETGTYMTPNRHYDPKLGRWTQPDPLFSGGYNPNDPAGLNYYNIMQSANLYVYCLNNPLRFFDPSGLVIELSSSATKEEIEQYNRAIAYLKTSEVGKALIEKLENATEVFTIMFVYDDNMYYDPSTREIFFDIYSGLITSDGTSIQSAALGLAHEMGHGAQHFRWWNGCVS